MALVMRYVAMPGSQGNADLLWFVPMMAIFLLPPLHRSLLPEKFVEHYTRGTWFKASFLTRIHMAGTNVLANKCTILQISLLHKSMMDGV